MTDMSERELLKQALSDLADGRASDEDARRLSAAWEDDAELRRDWQLTHLIGDTLRSNELAVQSQSSETLLSALRAEIAKEPVPLRPRRLVDWAAPLAVAAGFVLVAMIVPTAQEMLRPAGLPELRQADASLQSAPTGHVLGFASEPSFAQAAIAPSFGMLPADGQGARGAWFDMGLERAPAPVSTASSVTSGAAAR